MNVFVPILKVDAAQRLVYGSLASEAVDKSGEIFDYETSKPFVEAWSGEISKATNGKSEGNLRAMHGKVVAGKFVSVVCNDVTKSVDVAAKVIDDAEWKKVEEGCYTGFSIGGAYVKKWKDGEHTRYTAKPAEGSIVDNPANPGAHFTMVKADGTFVDQAFAQAPAADPESSSAPAPNAGSAPAAEGEPEQVWKCADGTTWKTKGEARAHDAEAIAKVVAEETPAGKLAAAVASIGAALTKAETGRLEKKDFTDDERKKLAESGEAMSDGSYPIRNKDDLKNAIQAFGRAKNKKAVMAHIKTRAKALGAEDMLPDSWKDSEKAIAAELRKDLDCVARLAYLLQSLEWLQQYLESEAAYERDDSPVPAALKEDIANLSSTLRQLVEEETNELLDGEESLEYGVLLEASARAPLHKTLGAKGAQLLAKAGARHSQADKENLDAAHDHVKKAMGEHGGACDKMLPGAEKSAAEAKMGHMVHAHNMTKAAGADCPGGDTKCAMYEAAKADAPAMSAKDHLDAAHTHLTKMGIGACGKEASAGDDLAKAGARHSQADLETLTHAHDALKAAGAGCPGDGEDKCAMAAAPAAEEPPEKMAKALADERAKNSTLEKTMADAVAVLQDFAGRLDKLENGPAPGPREFAAGSRSVSKQEDGVAESLRYLEDLKKSNPELLATAAIKLLQTNPGLGR